VNLSDVRAGLEAMLDSVPSIASASGWPVEQVNAVPAAFVGFNDAEITMAGLELSLHRLAITVLVQRKAGNLKNQVIAVEAVVDDVLRAIRANQDLGYPNDVNMVRYDRWQEGMYQVGSVDYVGFLLDITIKTTQAVTFA
jgi:hypothetical protein